MKYITKKLKKKLRMAELILYPSIVALNTISTDKNVNITYSVMDWSQKQKLHQEEKPPSKKRW
jgi:hypothetical protein